MKNYSQSFVFSVLKRFLFPFISIAVFIDRSFLRLPKFGAKMNTVNFNLYFLSLLSYTCVKLQLRSYYDTVNIRLKQEKVINRRATRIACAFPYTNFKPIAWFQFDVFYKKWLVVFLYKSVCKKKWYNCLILVSLLINRAFLLRGVRGVGNFYTFFSCTQFDISTCWSEIIRKFWPQNSVLNIAVVIFIWWSKIIIPFLLLR